MQEAKKITQTYSRVARALRGFEKVWQAAWEKTVEEAKAGLHATLIVRHPHDGKLHVNFDPEILKLIREAKCLLRLGVQIPESAQAVLLQEEKYKRYYDQLSFTLREYERLVTRVPPMCKTILRPHLSDLERRLQPGMVALTWTSMNIDVYLHRVHQGLARFGDLLSKINDIVSNRIESTLKTVARTVLVDLPEDREYKIDEFVATQERIIKSKAQLMDSKNMEVENAVNDLLRHIASFPLSTSDLRVLDADASELKGRFAEAMYHSILAAISASLNAIKNRITSRGLSSSQRPFFNVDVELSIPDVVLSPSLEEIQESLNQVALAVLRSAKGLYTWDQIERVYGKSTSYFAQIASDSSVVLVLLLLTGSIERVRRQVLEYLDTFRKHDFLWRQDLQTTYASFMATNPTMDMFEQELKHLADVEAQVAAIDATFCIGALRLETGSLKNSLKAEASNWKAQYAVQWHEDAHEQLLRLKAEIASSSETLAAPVNNLQDLRTGTLKFEYEL